MNTTGGKKQNFDNYRKIVVDTIQDGVMIVSPAGAECFDLSPAPLEEAH